VALNLSLKFVARQRREFPRLAAGAVNEGQGGGVDQAYDGLAGNVPVNFRKGSKAEIQTETLPDSRLL
jgi:hypothetical protein